MTVQKLKLGRERFVLLKEKDYRELKAKARAGSKSNSARKRRRSSAQDRGDIAESRRRRNEPALPYSQLRKELGLE